MSEEQKEDVVHVEIDTDDLDNEQLKLLAALGIEDDAGEPLIEQKTYDSLDDLLEFELHQDEGFWIDWPNVKGARLLLAHPEAAALAYPQMEREVRAKARMDPDDPLPTHLIVKAAGLAAFRRSVKSWELVLAGHALEFNQVNFMRMWRVRPFRDFLAAQARVFRVNPQSLSEDSGKG